MNSTDPKQTLASAYLQKIAAPETARISGELTAQLDNEDTAFKLLASFGVTDPSALDNPDEAALFGLQIALRQVGGILKTTVGVQVSEQQLLDLGANPATTLEVRVKRDAELILGHTHDRVKPEIFNAAFSKAGAVEALRDTEERISIHPLADGSAIARITRDRGNDALTHTLFALASKPEDVVGVEEAGKLSAQLHAVVEAIAQEHEGLSQPRYKARIETAVNSAVMDLFKALMAVENTVIGVDSPLEMISSLAKDQANGAWKPGFSVTVNGAPCATPEALNQALGAAPPVSMNDALSRLRASRAEPAAPAPAAKATKTVKQRGKNA